uniref:Uncharacterized protein n=1 Tax=Anguilla anguilla TaxID=7936 RepID=A0A0E9S3S8_ANGAN
MHAMNYQMSAEMEAKGVRSFE